MASSLVGLIDLFKREFFSSTKKKALKPLLTISVLWVLEKLLESSKYYNCPEEGYGLYGGMFLFGPALCLFTLTLILSNSFWDSATSCFRGKFDRVAVCRNTCHALVKSTLVACMWLTLAFATTDYFVCFRIGGGNKDSSKTNEMLRQSSVLAWCLLLTSITVAFVYNIIEKCCFTNTRESTILCDYERIEAEAAISSFKREAKALARKEGERKVKAILDEVKDGDKSAMDVVEKAKRWLIAKYSRSGKVLNKDYHVNGILLEEIIMENGGIAESNPETSLLDSVGTLTV